jgi:hypothetical protein
MRFAQAPLRVIIVPLLALALFAALAADGDLDRIDGAWLVGSYVRPSGTCIASDVVGSRCAPRAPKPRRPSSVPAIRASARWVGGVLLGLYVAFVRSLFA